MPKANDLKQTDQPRNNIGRPSDDQTLHLPTPNQTSHDELLEHFHPQDLPADFKHVGDKALQQQGGSENGNGAATTE